ncbi:hypothetical protein [Actinokineospora spheciospongiae]|uniref:hypothetical protein n=1 Tax=Actinokineospora spheciospongiae TaxID=909613 RepID=UPI0004B0553C|nr:hypothetical protein [Actinokineospora spheciospongiae]
MTEPVLLKILLKQRHLQGHRAFCKEYDRVAAKIEPDLVGGYPSKAQFYRWLSGDLIGLPYADHCRILESMFPEWDARQLFEPYNGSVSYTPEPDASPVTTDPLEHPPTGGHALAPSGYSPGMIAAYPYRSDFPVSKWWELITGTEKQMDLLGYTLYFLPLQHPQFVDTLRAKCEAGCVVRAAIADPASEHVANRDREEDHPITLVVRIHSTLKALQPLIGHENFHLRYQDIPLYNSVFRFDDQMLVTPHLYATPGSAAPLLHLRNAQSEDLFARFAKHFEDVWVVAQPVGQNPGVTDGSH